MRLAAIGAALAAMATVSSGLVPAVAATSTPGVTPPTYVQTIGGPGLPQMAPSGLDVDGQGNLYIADTADDQVAAYNAQGTQLWRVGTRGTKANGNFLNPRDVAYAGGLVYVADTGNNRLQVLDAATGAWQRTFSFHFTAIMGVGTGVDGSGNPIVLGADATQNRIDTFTPTGTFIRSIGTAGSGDGQLNQARDAVTDPQGNIYVADFKNERVEVFTASGGFVRAWGTKCPFTGTCTTPGQFKDPYGIVRDAAGNIYVSDNYRIQEFTSTGTFVNQFGQACPKGSCTGNQLFQLRRVAVGAGSSPNVYAADLWGYKVVEYDQTGTVVKVFGNVGPGVGGFNDEFGLALFDNTLFVVDTNNQRIQQFNPWTGVYLANWDHRGYGTDLNGVNWPRDITGNSQSNTLWLADTKNYRLIEFQTNGTATGRVIGTTGSILEPSILNWTYGLTSWGSYIITADTFNNRVEAWDGTSSTTPVWTATGMKSPEAVTVSGNTVYVADTNNSRVVELNAATGNQITSLGSSAMFGHPDGIGVAPNGNVWVADSGKNRLTEITSAGVLVQNFGKFGALNNQFNGPAQIAIGPGSSAGTTWLYVADSNNDRVQVFDITKV
jgi:sugar lactone lactonase YvrE